MGVREVVEESLARGVAGRPYVLRLGPRRRAPAKPTADDAHSARPRRPWAGGSRPRRSWTGWTGARSLKPAPSRAFGPGTEVPGLCRPRLNEALIGKSRPRWPRTGRAIRRRASARRAPLGRCFCRLPLFLFRAEPLYQDAATLAVGHEAGALVRPRFVRDLEVIAPGAAIGSAQRRIVLAPGMAAARTAGRLFGALIALTFAQWAPVVAIAASGGLFAAAALVRAIAKHTAQFPALLAATRRFGRPRGDRGAEIATGLRNDPGAKLRAKIFCFDFLDGALRKRTEPERPEFDPDQAIDLKAEMGKHVAHFAVLAFADRKGEPDIGALLALERRLDCPVMNAVNGH